MSRMSGAWGSEKRRWNSQTLMICWIRIFSAAQSLLCVVIFVCAWAWYGDQCWRILNKETLGPQWDMKQRWQAEVTKLWKTQKTLGETLRVCLPMDSELLSRAWRWLKSFDCSTVSKDTTCETQFPGDEIKWYKTLHHFPTVLHSFHLEKNRLNLPSHDFADWIFAI